MENTEESISYHRKTAESITSERLYSTAGYITTFCSRKKKKRWNDVHAQFNSDLTSLNAILNAIYTIWVGYFMPTGGLCLVKMKYYEWITRITINNTKMKEYSFMLD